MHFLKKFIKPDFNIYVTVSETSNVSLDSDISEFLPELQSLETQAALEVPLTSQDPPEVDEVVPERKGGRGKKGQEGVRRRPGRGRGNTSATSGQGLYHHIYIINTVYFFY